MRATRHEHLCRVPPYNLNNTNLNCTQVLQKLDWIRPLTIYVFSTFRLLILLYITTF
jgi:hypothetical protein